MNNILDNRLLQLLSQTFPNSESASTEIINLEAILSLPKGTEHFVADIHGEHEAFLHILRNASGNIKRKVHDLFDGTLPKEEMHDLCTLIYYPEKRLEMIEEGTDEDLSAFYARTLLQLIQVCRSPRLPSRRMPTTRARSSSQTTKRPIPQTTRSRCASSHRCTRPSPSFSSLLIHVQAIALTCISNCLYMYKQ